LVFIDESGFMLQPLTRRTWAPKGKTPVLKAWDRHERLTCITALTISPIGTRIGQYFQIQRTNAKADHFFWFIVELKRQLKRPLIVIWDRLSAHLKTESYFRQFEIDWVQFEYLPAYSPELNPVEHVWTTTKWGRLSNWAAPGIEQLNHRLTEELGSQKKEKQLLRSHFNWAKLPLG
jgi:transposase